MCFNILCLVGILGAVVSKTVTGVNSLVRLFVSSETQFSITNCNASRLPLYQAK